MSILEIKNITKTYGKLKALDSVSFNIKKGEIFGLLGPNGAGKSTLINIAAGIITKDSGNVNIFGKDFDKHEEEIKQQMNVTSAYSYLTGILTVEQNLRVYGKLYNVKNVNKRIETLLKSFKIWNLRKKKYHSLSSGQAMRVNVCKGLINNPKLLFLDEATVGLDPDIAAITRDMIKYYNTTGTTILFTSHIMSEVEELCNRIAFLYKGKLLKIDSAKNFKKLIKKQIVEIDFTNKIKDKSNIKKILSKRNNKLLSFKNKLLKFENYDEEQVHEIIHLFYKNKFKIKDIRILKPTLDEIFIKIARDQL